MTIFIQTEIPYSVFFIFQLIYMSVVCPLVRPIPKYNYCVILILTECLTGSCYIVKLSPFMPPAMLFVNGEIFE